MTIDSATRPGIARRILAFPLVWAVLGAALIIIGDSVLVGIGRELDDLGSLTMSLIGAAYSIGAYLFVMRVLARRRVPELTRRVGIELPLGIAIGAVFIVGSVVIVAALGVYTVTWHPVDVGRVVAMSVGVSLTGAIVEELVFRGLALQAVERLAGTWVALAVTALLFGAAHLLNPGASLWSSIAIAIEAGLFLGAGFVWRRSIAFVVGIHVAWNALEGLFGIPVSGHRAPGLFSTTVDGPALLTGGDFGIEASIVPIALSLALSVAMLVLARRRGFVFASGRAARRALDAAASAADPAQSSTIPAR